MVKSKSIKQKLKQTWKFFWHSDSIWSWVANLIVAFLLIRFIVYPVLGMLLGTSYPIVAVVSESMEHNQGDLCGQGVPEFPDSFDNYWDTCGYWYEGRGISKQQFQTFPFPDGFRKGDVIILWRANQNNLAVGDILVFQSIKVQPLIHRVVRVWQEDGQYFYQTKGDHNQNSYSALRETKISAERIYGQGLFRIPYLGWLKIIFVDAVKPLGINIQH